MWCSGPDGCGAIEIINSLTPRDKSPSWPAAKCFEGHPTVVSPLIYNGDASSFVGDDLEMCSPSFGPYFTALSLPLPASSLEHEEASAETAVAHGGLGCGTAQDCLGEINQDRCADSWLSSGSEGVAKHHVGRRTATAARQVGL